MNYEKILRHLNFKSETNQDKNAKDALYTQLLAAQRIEEHDVVYIFDEVGCGKTTSSSIAMAQVMVNAEERGEYAKILVFTALNVCKQFCNDVIDTLTDATSGHLYSNKVLVMGYYEGSDYKNYSFYNIEKAIQDNRHVICIVNDSPDAVYEILHTRTKEYKWDLLVIDEAHNIMCNSYEQTSFRYRYISPGFQNHKPILEAYIDFQKKVATMGDWERRNAYGRTQSPKNQLRTIANQTLSFLCNYGNASKIMFLTATPTKYDSDFDILHYAYTACCVLNHGTSNFIACLEHLADYLPNFDWIEDYYSIHPSSPDSKVKEDKVKEAIGLMEKSNTSLSFKEITRSLSRNQKNKCEIGFKERRIDLWNMEEGIQNIHSLIQENADKSNSKLPNRFIIFVSKESEGNKLMQLLFPAATEFPNCEYHWEIPSSTGSAYRASCLFVMNKFGNKDQLNIINGNRSDDSVKIPDILIVNYQIAEVGINLPTFNYVINYNISPNYGRLEQRFGRIDRLGTKYETLNNIFLLDEENVLYQSHLFAALYSYVDMITKKQKFSLIKPIPVKNLLFCNCLLDKIPNATSQVAYYEELERLVAFSLFKNGKGSPSDSCVEEMKKKIRGKLGSCTIEGSVVWIGSDQGTKPYDYSAEAFQNAMKDERLNPESSDDTKQFLSEIQTSLDVLLNTLTGYYKIDMLRHSEFEEFARPGTIIYFADPPETDNDSMKYLRKCINLKEFTAVVNDNI